MKKSTFLQEFTFAVNVGCLHRNWVAKLLMPSCARAKHVAHKGVYVFIREENKCS